MAAPALHRIESEGLAAEISEAGAELVRLVDHAGADWLWNGDPAFWSGRAPLLFPIVGTLAGGRFHSGGRAYTLPRHGFARHSRFVCTEAAGDRLTLSLVPDAAIRENWPFDFRLDMRFSVAGPTLSVVAEVTNSGSDRLPASFGFHPAFRWPLPGEADRSSHEIAFDQDEPASVRRLDRDGLVDPATRPTPILGRRLPLDDGLFLDDALILDRPASRTVTFRGRHSAVRVDFPDMPHLAFWTKPGARFLCVEPWHGHSDPAGFDGSIEEKPGTILIEPGKRHEFAMQITIGQAG
ncbi:MAG: aldose 1-epimerase family protein [Pseudomonadota bacterium]